jgi:hypothetical protein
VKERLPIDNTYKTNVRPRKIRQIYDEITPKKRCKSVIILLYPKIAVYNRDISARMKI